MDGNVYSYYLMPVPPLYVACMGEGEITSLFSFTDRCNFTGIIPKEPHPNIDLGFPGGAVVENLPAYAGDMGSSPGLGRSSAPAEQLGP